MHCSTHYTVTHHIRGVGSVGTLARLPWSGEPYFIHWPHHPDICGHTMELHSTAIHQQFGAFPQLTVGRIG